MKKQITALLLLSAMLTSTVACGGTETPTGSDDTTTAAQGGETTPAVTGRDAVSDDLPEKKFDKTFTILDRTLYAYEFEVEEQSGDLVSDAIYTRNGKVADRFGVEFKYHTLDCLWGDQATAFNNTLRSSVMAGDGAFDLVAGYAATIPGLVGEGIFHNWAEMEHIDFSKPWWSKAVADELTINGKAYMATGDISLALWEGMTCFYFNKELASSYGIDDMYGIVKSGDWTLDKLIELTKDVYKDLDGDNEKDEDDFYGLLLMRDTEVDNMKEAFEIKVTEKGKDGFPEVVFVNERTIEAVEKLNSYIHNSGNVLFPTTGGDDGRAQLRAAFEEKRGIFFASTLGRSEELRAMESDFGIIPYPKYDSNQTSYHSSSLDEFSLFLVPIDVKDVEMSAIITEALCAESYKNVVPAFYDVTLKNKGARDDESGEMIDMIRDGLIFDWGYLHSSTIGGVGHLFVNFIRDNSNNVASTYDAKVDTIATKLATALEIYR